MVPWTLLDTYNAIRDRTKQLHIDAGYSEDQANRIATKTAIKLAWKTHTKAYL